MAADRSSAVLASPEMAAAASNFYKIALPITRTLGPRIPQEYLRQHMEEEAQGGVATLMVSSNSQIWRVQLTMDGDGGLVFKGGWERFYTDNSLNDEDVLVFKYHGHLKFGVDIFDKTGIRIK